MNQEQIGALLRTILQVFGSVLVTKGALDPDQANEMMNAGMMAFGAAMTLGTLGYGIYKRSDRNLVKAARKVEGVPYVRVR